MLFHRRVSLEVAHVCRRVSLVYFMFPLKRFCGGLKGFDAFVTASIAWAVHGPV